MEGWKRERGIKERDITGTVVGLKRAKGGGGGRRPQRETAPVRPKCGSPQGVSSLTSASHPCAHEPCNKLLTTVTLGDLQLVCGSYPLTLTPLILH